MKRKPGKPIQLSPEQVQELEATVFALAERVLDERFYLLDVAMEQEAGAWFLRLYVEAKAGSIALSDCEQISRALDGEIDILPVLAELPYSLEVSSPGVFRPLQRAREYAFYAGRSVRIGAAPAKTSKKPIKQSQAPVVEGVLKAYQEESNTVVLQEPLTGNTREICLDGDQVVYLNPVLTMPDEEEDAADASESLSETP